MAERQPTQAPAAQQDEIWKDIPGYEGRYQASTLGRVRSVPRVIPGRRSLSKERIMSVHPRAKNAPHLVTCFRDNGKAVTMAIHRIMYMTFIGEIPDGMIVDHIDRNPLNNALDNLRLATFSQNRANSNTACVNTSGFKGVYWHRPSGKWHASTAKDGKRIHIGSFVNKDDAVMAYNTVARELFGEFACIKETSAALLEEVARLRQVEADAKLLFNLESRDYGVYWDQTSLEITDVAVYLEESPGTLPLPDAVRAELQKLLEGKCDD